MVRDGYSFDEELVRHASEFLDSLRLTIKSPESIDNCLTVIEQDSPHLAVVFVDSITMLQFSPSNRLAFVSSELLHRISSIYFLRNLSVIVAKVDLVEILTIFISGIDLSHYSLQTLDTHFDIDPNSIRDVVLQEFLIPIEPSLAILSRNPHLLSWNNECYSTLKLLTSIFDVSAFHQPLLNFICSSPIPMVYHSLLKTVEDDDPKQFFIGLMNDIIRKWKHDGASTWRRGRILMQTLERGGFLEALEKELLHNASSEDRRNVRLHSYVIMNLLGMNSPRPE